jgi:hypothetical protein
LTGSFDRQQRIQPKEALSARYATQLRALDKLKASILALAPRRTGAFIV